MIQQYSRGRWLYDLIKEGDEVGIYTLTGSSTNRIEGFAVVAVGDGASEQQFRVEEKKDAFALYDSYFVEEPPDEKE